MRIIDGCFFNSRTVRTNKNCIIVFGGEFSKKN
jgi:hypothetical protein